MSKKEGERREERGERREERGERREGKRGGGGYTDLHCKKSAGQNNARMAFLLSKFPIV